MYTRLDQDRMRYQSPAFRLIIANLLIVLVICIASGFFAYINYRESIDSARNEARNAAARYHDNAWLILSSIDSVLNASIERKQDDPDAETLHDFLEQTAASLTFVRTLIIVSPDGEVVADSRPDEPAIGVNIEDRQYIINFVDGLVEGLDIEAPVASRVDGAWSTPVTLASYDEDGNVRWMASTALDPVYFAGLFIRTELDRVDTGFIVNARGVVVGTIPFDETLLNTSIRDTELFTDHFMLADDGVYTGTSPLDDSRSIIAYRRAAPYPLYIVTSIELSTVYKQIFQTTLSIIAVALILIATTTAISRHQIKQLQLIESQTRTLHFSEERFQTLFTVSPVGIALFDGDLIVDANQHFAAITGHSLKAKNGNPVNMQAITAQLLPHMRKHLDTDGQFHNVEFQITDAQGGIVPLLASGQRITLDEDTLTLVAITDISDRIAAENARQTAGALRVELEQEQELHQFKTHLVSMIAHDLRNPISVIMSSADMLNRYRERFTDEQKLEHLEKIVRQVDTINAMIDEISGLRDEVVEPPDPQWELIQFEPMLRTLVENIRTTTRNSNPIEMQHSGRSYCRQDTAMLQKILVNLLTNAVKYSPDGEAINLTTICNDGDLTIVVEDKGIGIPEKDQERLFEIFYRASNVGGRFGTGIGLAIVKQTVERLNGTISFESKENEGTRFVVTLPLRQGENSESN